MNSRYHYSRVGQNHVYSRVGQNHVNSRYHYSRVGQNHVCTVGLVKTICVRCAYGNISTAYVRYF